MRRIVMFWVVLACAFALVVVGTLAVRHELYSRFGQATAEYTGCDPVLIREFSFS